MPRPIKFSKSSNNIYNSDGSDISEQTKLLSSRIKPQDGSSHIYSKDNSSHNRVYNKSNRISSINNNNAKKYGSKVLKNYKNSSTSRDNKISSNPLARALNADFNNPDNHNNNRTNHAVGSNHKVPPKFSENALAKALSLGSNAKFSNDKQKVNGSASIQQNYKTNTNKSNNSISRKKKIDFNSSNADTFKKNATSPRNNISLNFKNAALPKFLLLQNLDPGTSADDVTAVLEANIGKVKFVKTKYDAQLKGISAEVIFSEPSDTVGANGSLSSITNDSGSNSSNTINNSNVVATNKVEALVNSAVQMFDGISSDGRELMASSPLEPTVLSKKELLLISKTN